MPKKEKKKKFFELWFRVVYKQLIKNKKLTAALRPGNRISPHPKGTKVGEKVTLRIVLKPGDDETRQSAILDNKFKKNAQITALTVKPLGQLTKKDFLGMSPDCQSLEDAKYHLGLIYNKIFSNKDLVTIIRWKY